MKTDWPSAMKPLIAKYKKVPHPLEYKNLYQLLIMVVLSAQDSDKHINSLAPALFKAFPNMKALAKADEGSLAPYIGKVRGSRKKMQWLMEIAQTVKDDKKIPLTLDGLVALLGIGLMSANVIMRVAKVKAEGVMVDLHVVRVAPRLGIAKGTDPKKIEQQLMEVLPQKQWSDAGMAMSFLGRETCRPTNPKHSECLMKKVCAYYKEALG
jgi:endonuclease-3